MLIFYVKIIYLLTHLFKANFNMQEDAEFKQKQKEQEKQLREARERAAKGPLGNIAITKDLLVDCITRLIMINLYCILMCTF